MKMDEKELREVKSFFNNDLLAECFIQLFNYQLLSIPDVILEIRGDSLIGFKRQGERLRLYVTKSSDGKFYIKIKSATSHLFIPAEMVNYRSDLDRNNKYFVQNHDKLIVKVKPNEAILPPKISEKITHAGKRRITIRNLGADNHQIVLDELTKIAKAGAKEISIAITVEE